MDTHEHLLADEDLPGHGILDPDFVRERIREQEESQLLIWDEDEQKYHPSARMLLGTIGMEVVAKARDIDPAAGTNEITEAVVSCLPWAAGVTAVDLDDLPPGFRVNEDGHAELDPDAVSVEVADTFPEDWIEQ